VAGAHLVSVASTFPSPPFLSPFPPLLSSLFPPFPSTSLRHILNWSVDWHLVVHKVGGGLVVPTGTGRLHDSGDATPVGVAPQQLLYVVYKGTGVV
jgi:hypothetical protein